MNRKNIFYVVFAVLFVACFVFYALSSGDKKYGKIKYQIEYPSDTLFSEAEFSRYIATVYPSIIGKVFDSVNLSAFEKKVEKYPYISDADVINNRGTLVVKAVQEKIIAKVFNNKDQWFLLAESGKLVPKSKNNAGRIIVINGNISQSYIKDSIIYASDRQGKTKYFPLHIAWKIACFIEKDPFWKAQIGQIYINDSQEIELVPTVGEHVVLFGSIYKHENMEEVIEEKFDNLKSLYIEGFKITGWDKYKTINLKYGTEIPCEKRINKPQ